MRRVVRLVAGPALSAAAVLVMSLLGGCTALDPANGALNQDLGLQPTLAHAQAYWDEQAREYTAYLKSIGDSTEHAKELTDYAISHHIPADDGIDRIKKDYRRRINDWVDRQHSLCFAQGVDQDRSAVWFQKCLDRADDAYHAAEAKVGLRYQSTQSSGGGIVTEEDLLLGMMPDGPPMLGVPYGAPQ